MAHDQRLGLVTVPSADGVKPSYKDARQWVLAAAAARAFAGQVLGGQGVYHGAPAVLADLVDGQQCPALVALVTDSADQSWPAVLPQTAITFSLTSGSAKLYLVKRLLAGVTPAAADGAADAFDLVAQAAASAAPANSLLLGTGTVTASAFTSWTAADTAPSEALLTVAGGGGGGGSLLHGTGAPDSGLGADGDWYLDDSNGHLYGKASSAWSLIVDLTGPAGAAGSTGAAGADGRTILNGTGAPSGGTGANGDYYVDNTAHALYGPKTGGAWGSGVSLVGPTGAAGTNGTNGTNGYSVLNGSGAPSGGTGANGDFYIDTTAHAIYGPKAGGAWGSSTSLVGPAGAAGSTGATGPGVPAGGTALQVLRKISSTNYDTEWADAAGGGGTFDPDAVDTLTFTKNVANPPPALASRTALSSARRWVATAEYNGWAYVIGGYTTTGITTVEKAAINSDGTLGSWGAVTSLPAARYYQGAFAKDGYLWAIGGNSHPGYVCAPINSDGTLGSWTAVSMITDYLARANNTSWALGPHGLYQVGGNVYGYPMTTVDFFAPSGPSLAFYVSTELPLGLWQVAAVVCNGYLFSLGGNNGSATVTNVYSAHLASISGEVGSWVQQRSLPESMQCHSALAYNGRIWVFCDDLMYSARVRDDGSLGPWIDEGTGPGLLDTTALPASSGRGYLLGGYHTGANVTTVNQLWSAATDVEYTVGIGDDGVLWVERGADPVVGFGGYPGDPNIVVTTGADGTIDIGQLPDGLLVASSEGTPLTKVNIGGGTPSWTPTANECRMVFDDDYRWLWIFSSYGWQKFTPGY